MDYQAKNFSVVVNDLNEYLGLPYDAPGAEYWLDREQRNLIWWNVKVASNESGIIALYPNLISHNISIKWEFYIEDITQSQLIHLHDNHMGYFEDDYIRGTIKVRSDADFEFNLNVSQDRSMQIEEVEIEFTNNIFYIS